MSTLIQSIKDRITQAMREKKEIEKNLLRTALGEIQTEESRRGTLSDVDIEKVLRKVLKSLRETLCIAEERNEVAVVAHVRQEIVILESILPKTLSVEEIQDALASIADAIRTADQDGVAIGIAMKHLKGNNAPVHGEDVADTVNRLRSPD